jgi:hypothetical protein
MMLKYLFPILSLTVFAVAPQQHIAGNPQKEIVVKVTDTGYATYQNNRFGYSIDYPKNNFIPQPESDYGDGCIFFNTRQQEVLRVFGRYNTPEDGPAIALVQQFNSDIKSAIQQHKTITYKKLGKTFYVLSGYSNTTIFYQKTILLNGNFAYAILQYPVKEKAFYNRLITPIFSSFR